MGKNKQKHGGGKGHDHPPVSKTDVEDVIKLACHNRTEDIKEHKLRPSVGKDAGKVTCACCERSNISADKKTVVDHIKSKAHLIAKGDQEPDEKKEEVDESDLFPEADPTGAGILSHPQLAGVVLGFLCFKFQGRCSALSRKIRKNIVDTISDISILDLCVVFQPIEITGESHEQRQIRKAFFAKNTPIEGKKQKKQQSAVASSIDWSDDDNDGGEWQREPTHEDKISSTHDYWGNRTSYKPRKVNSQYAQDASARLQWCFVQLRKAHKTPEKAEYWIARLKELIFVPVESAIHKNAEQLGIDHVLLLPRCFSCPRKSNFFMHISSPRIPSSLTIIDNNSYEGAGQAQNYLKDVKRVDLVVGPGLDCPNFGKSNYYSSKDCFTSLEHLTVRNLGNRVRLRDYFCARHTTIDTVVLVGEPFDGESKTIDLPKEFCYRSTIREIHFVGIDGIRSVGSSCCRGAFSLTVFDLSLLSKVDTFPRRCFYQCPAVTPELAKEHFLGLREVTQRKGGRLRLGQKYQGLEVTAAFQLNEGDTTPIDDCYY